MLIFRNLNRIVIVLIAASLICFYPYNNINAYNNIKPEVNEAPRPLNGFIFLADGNIKYKNEPEGFRDFKWAMKMGPDIIEKLGMKLEGKLGDSGYKIYSIKNDLLQLENIKLDILFYRSWNDKFDSVLMHINKQYWNNIKDLLFKKYGNGLQENKSVETFMWPGQTTKIILTHNEDQPESKPCSLVLLSIKINNEILLHDMAKNKQADKP